MFAGLRVQDSNGNALHAATVARRGARSIEVTVGRTVRAYIGLGANVGDARTTLTDAVAALAAMPGARLRGVSRLFRTKPVGVTDQPDFLNAAVAMDVPAGPDPATGATNLLVALKDLEREFGRRKRRRWGPRELDLDLLLFGRHRLAIERPPEGAPLSAAIDPGAAVRLLEVPHASMRDRLFVLAPLADLAPGLVPPGWRETIRSARDAAATFEGSSAAQPIGRWDATAWTAEPGSSFVIRRATPGDARTMAGVHARSWRATYAGLVPDAVIADVVRSRQARIERWRTWLGEPDTQRGSFVATVDARVVGFVFWGPSDDPDVPADAAEVPAIYLDPSVTGRGIGRALLDAAIGAMVARGFGLAVLWVLEGNAPARRFYEGVGWQPDGATKTEQRPGGTLRELRYRRSLQAVRTGPASATPRPANVRSR
jgi:2-amino-4-hydroxy-6-hydroxymethyldihydropteridine diphosphokinase